MFGDATFRGNVYRHNYFHHIGSRWAGAADAKLGRPASGSMTPSPAPESRATCSTTRGRRARFGAIQIHGGKDNQVENNLFVDCNAAISFSPGAMPAGALS